MNNLYFIHNNILTNFFKELTKYKNDYQYFFFFFRESFNLWHLLLMSTLYHQTKKPINFWYRRGLNHRSLIQPLEILPVELTETHTTNSI